MKVLFWVPYPTEGPSNRYRVEQYLPYLRKVGIDYCLRPFWRSSAYRILYTRRHYLKKAFFFIFGNISRILDLLGIIRCDVVFIHRESCPLGATFFESFLKIMRKPFIYDFDDAIFFASSSTPNSFIEHFKNPDKIEKIIEMSECVIAGNSYLANFALKFNKNVKIIPTAIDSERYYPQTKKDSEKIVIGWIGSITTLKFVDLIRGVFKKLSMNFSNVWFKIVGGNIQIDGVPNIICKPWSEKDEIEDLRGFDIGIMPMPDNEWTRGKCGFKAILYMSMGIPCVCSPVGVNKEIITDGINGFLADREDDWAEKLSLLIRSPELRKNIGLAGRKTVEEKYSVRVNAPRFLEVIQRVYDSRKREL